MEQQPVTQQGDIVDAYDFPIDLIGSPLISWMGENYIRYLAAALLQRFQEQDAGTKLLGMKCEQRPKFVSRAHQTTGAFTKVVADFELQLLLLDSTNRCWRLQGVARLTADGLDLPEPPPVQVAFEIRSKDQVT